jgi:uncharacterized protein (TIGR00725 family)
MPNISKLPQKHELTTEQITSKGVEGRIINRITFFGDSAIPEGDAIYKSVYEASKLLAQEGFTIVNGGGPGLMKAATDGAEEVGGDTIAIYWEPTLATFFEGKNLANVADETESQSNYINRTFGLIEKGDVYVVCKGGTGTISELGLVWCLAKLYFGVHKPVILYGEFWPELIEAIKKGMYIDEKELAVLYFANTPFELLEIIKMHDAKIDRSKLRNYTGDEAAFLLRPNAQTTAKSYDKFAHKYQNNHTETKLVSKDQLDEFISMIHAPAQILDIGCGPGFDTKYLSRKYSVTGVEISKRFAQMAQFENPNADIIYCDIVDYELPKNLYKGVWARDSLHHIKSEDQDVVFKKIADSLVEDGVFYVIVREGEGQIVEKENKDYGEIERFYHQYSVEELTSRAEKAGLTMVKIDHIQKSHKWLVGVFKKTGK